jgi:hypothetical protein
LVSSFKPLDQGQPQARAASMAIRKCKCGAAYERTEHVSLHREIRSFECILCHRPLESWQSAFVPRYRFVAGPVKVPTSDN